jgi:hypothetical protein
MSIEKKQSLIELGAEGLADALLELASRVDAASDLVDRMIATPEENIKRFKAKLVGLKRRRRFIPWGESGTFAGELAALLEDLKAGVNDPRTGCELVAAFYEADRGALGSCDDSNGSVGDVFRFDARDLFVSFASECAEKEWLGELVFHINQEDDYGVRDTLIDCASEYLPEPVMRDIIGRLWKSAEKESNEYRKSHWLRMVESLARQLKDAPLFEKARIASWGKISTAACIDIARVYLESGDANTSLSWLERIPAGDTFKADEKNRLLLEVYGKLGQSDKQAEIAWRIFRSCRSVSSLSTLLNVIGEEERERVITTETALILREERLSYSDASFLISVGRMVEAESYLLAHAGQLNGDFYNILLPLAEAMEKDGRMLIATIIYRALLDSILRRAQSKYYTHGIRYLKKLDRLAEKVSDWRSVSPHADYHAGLRRDHGRKSAFWGKYDK